MRKNYLYSALIGFSALLISCSQKTKEPVEKDQFITENVEFAYRQLGNEIKVIETSGKLLNPVTLNTDSTVYYCGFADWRSGFFPAQYGICMN